MVRESYEPPTMKLDVWRKDMALIGEFAARCGVTTPLFSAAAPVYEAAIAHGLGAQDTAAVREVLEDMARGGGRRVDEEKS
jgi:putative dehydrogenase